MDDWHILDPKVNDTNYLELTEFKCSLTLNNISESMVVEKVDKIIHPAAYILTIVKVQIYFSNIPSTPSSTPDSW